MTHPNTEQPADTSLKKLADVIESMICDWNAPKQLTGSVRGAAEQMAAWHQSQTTALLKRVREEVIEAGVIFLTKDDVLDMELNGKDAKVEKYAYARERLRDEQRKALDNLEKEIMG